jgi:hypothetical protein
VRAQEKKREIREKRKARVTEVTRAFLLRRALGQQAGTILIERREPVTTARGKVLPLHIDRD